MANFNDFMSDMRGGRPGGFSGMGDRRGGFGQRPGMFGQRPGMGGMGGQMPPQFGMPGQRPGGPISALPMPYPGMGGPVRDFGPGNMPMPYPGMGKPPPQFGMPPGNPGFPDPRGMPPPMGGGMSQDQKQADYQRFVQNQQMNGAPVMSMAQWSAASAPTQQQAHPPGLMGSMPPPGMNPQFMQQGQALDAARQAALQGIPAYQQLQQLSGQFKMGGQPTPEQAQQMEQLSQQLNTNPTLQGFNDKMQALSTQYGANGMGGPTPPTGMTGLGGMNPAMLSQSNFKSQADMNAAMTGLSSASPISGMHPSNFGMPGMLPQGMNGGVPQPQQLGAGLPQQGALNALQAQPAVMPQSAMAGQAAPPAQGGLNQVAAMSSPTAPVKGAALPAQ